jgi:Uma2 family endonuclease
MSTATKLDSAPVELRLVSVEDYLESELNCPTKHEYVDGAIYAMAGARIVHNVITLNVSVALAVRLNGQRCQPYNSETKIRIELPTHVRFYYPDVSVVCESNPWTDSFQDKPAVIIEVLSEKTRRIDSGEKRLAYLTIPSLTVYAMVEQDSPAVIVFRRSAKGFDREVLKGLESVLPLKEIGIDLPLSEIYKNVKFNLEPEAADED